MLVREMYGVCQMLFEGGEAFPALVHDGAVCVPSFAMQLDRSDAILPQRQLPRLGERGLGIFMLALADLKSYQQGEWSCPGWGIGASLASVPL